MTDGQGEQADGASQNAPQQTWFKTLAKVAGIVLAAVGGFETISDIPDTIAKYKTFFPILGHLLFDAFIIGIDLVLPICLIILVLGAIHGLLLLCFSILTSQHTKRHWLTIAQGGIMPIPLCIALIGIAYLAVISDGHPFDEMQNRVVNWYRDRQIKEEDNRWHKKVQDCIANSRTEEEKWDCRFLP